jgi:D-sedoheptulose 7-phosphate isomerase
MSASAPAKTQPNAQSNALESLFRSSAGGADYAAKFFARLQEVLARVEAQSIGEVIDALERAQELNKSIFFVANGGSAAVASHIVNDLCANNIVPGKRGFRAFCLADNVESITAIANDSCFENIFCNQLACHMCPGDVVVALSVSGNSENIIRAVDYANEHGGLTIGMAGMDGGRLLQKTQIRVAIPSTRDEYGPVEDIFSNIGHVLTGYITMKRGKMLAH